MTKTIKKIKAMAVVTMIGATSLIGCSGSGDKKAKDGKVDLELFSTKAENKDILQSLINEFEKENPNIKITINAPADSGTVLKSRLAKEDVPDIIAVGADNNYGTLVDANILVD